MAKNRDRQKAKEKNVFEQFLALQKGIIPENISPGYEDKPDVIMELPGNKKVGVELMGLYKSNAEQELEGIKQSILLETREGCIKRCWKRFRYGVFLSCICGPPKSRIQGGAVDNEKTEGDSRGACISD